MQKSYHILIGLILSFAIGGIVYTNAQATPNATNAPEANATTTYAMADVAEHDSESSCWSVINSKVYDLTSWIPKHPGGPEAILSICGIDGSDAFNAQHGGSSLQERILTGFKIGSLNTQ